MNQLPGSSTLRLALDAIANRHAGPTVRLQISEVEQLRPRFKHSIELVEAVDDASAGSGQFTCFMHALELVPPTVRVAAIMQRFDVIPPAPRSSNS